MHPILIAALASVLIQSRVPTATSTADTVSKHLRQLHRCSVAISYVFDRMNPAATFLYQRGIIKNARFGDGPAPDPLEPTPLGKRLLSTDPCYKTGPADLIAFSVEIPNVVSISHSGNHLIVRYRLIPTELGTRYLLFSKAHRIREIWVYPNRDRDVRQSSETFTMSIMDSKARRT